MMEGVVQGSIPQMEIAEDEDEIPDVVEALNMDSTEDKESDDKVEVEVEVLPGRPDVELEREPNGIRLI